MKFLKDFVQWLRPCTRFPMENAAELRCKEVLSQLASSRKALTKEIIEMIAKDHREPRRLPVSAFEAARQSAMAGGRR